MGVISGISLRSISRALETTNTIFVGKHDGLEAAIAKAIASNVSIANPIAILVSAGIFVAPVGGFNLAGIQGLSIIGMGKDQTKIYPNPADTFSDNFVFVFDDDSKRIDISNLHIDLSSSTYFGGAAYFGGEFNTFTDCKLSWSHGYCIIGGPHEGGFHSCDFVAQMSYDTDDVCISAGDETWTAGTNVTFSNDTLDKIHHDASAVFTVGAGGVANGAAIGNIATTYGSNASNTQTQVLWIKSNTGLAAGALTLKLSTAAGGAGNICSFALPALTANTWTRIKYNHDGVWNSTIAEVRLANTSGATLAAGVVIKLNDYWLERLRNKTNRLIAFAGAPAFMHVTDCTFAVRQYIANPFSGRKTVIGITEVGTPSDFYRYTTIKGLYSGTASEGYLHINGGRIHHTIKRYGHCEVFHAHDKMVLSLGSIPVVIWSDSTPAIDGTEHILRLIVGRQTAKIGCAAPVLTLTNYGVSELDANIHTLDYTSSNPLTLSGAAYVYNLADLPAASICNGAVIMDRSAGKLKISNGTDWSVV